ncbi:MAG: vWA domain-containing protein [Leeuwenhoekiella sp.]
MKKLILPLCLALFSMLSCEGDGTFLESDESAVSRLSSDSGSVPTSGGEPDNSGLITAGEWNDLENWDFWTGLITGNDFNQMSAYWGIYTKNRFSIEVRDTNNNSVVDATVQLLLDNEVIWESRTDNSGKAELFADVFEDKMLEDIRRYRIAVNNSPIDKPLQTIENGVIKIETAASAAATKTVELAFIVDATGSMGDELEFLKDDLKSVIQKVKIQNQTIDIATSAVFYRDEGDDYVVRKSVFSKSIDATLSFISKQSAGGGGDFPEAVHTALNTAVNDLQWSTTAKSRIAFLMLDAPPHYEEQVIDDLHNSIEQAAKKGIKIIPITASGIDKNTEFLMRFMSISTNGTYVFITNHSGIGEDHLAPTVGDYDVEYLNALMVRLISEYSE